MKKMLLLLAGMVCLGMFVSCSNEPQEVVIVDSVGGTVGLTGYADGTVISQSNSSTTYSYSVNKQKWATLSYPELAKGNKSYNLTVPIIYSYASSSTQFPDSARITIVKIDDKYYDSLTEQNIEVKGSLEGGDFTVMAVSGSSSNSRYSFTNLSFKKGVAK